MCDRSVASVASTALNTGRDWCDEALRDTSQFNITKLLLRKSIEIAILLILTRLGRTG